MGTSPQGTQEHPRQKEETSPQEDQEHPRQKEETSPQGTQEHPLGTQEHPRQKEETSPQGTQEHPRQKEETSPQMKHIQEEPPLLSENQPIGNRQMPQIQQRFLLANVLMRVAALS